VQTNGARSGGEMVVSWTLFRAASQESGLGRLETGARPDEAVARFETEGGRADESVEVVSELGFVQAGLLRNGADTAPISL